MKTGFPRDLQKDMAYPDRLYRELFHRVKLLSSPYQQENGYDGYTLPLLADEQSTIVLSIRPSRGRYPENQNMDYMHQQPNRRLRLLL